MNDQSTPGDNDDKSGSPIRSFLQFSVGPWTSAVVSFFTAPLISWFIVPVEYGKASFFTIAYSLTFSIILVGTDNSFVRLFYEKDTDKRADLLRNSMAVPLGLWAILAVVAFFNLRLISNLLFGQSSSEAGALILVFAVLAAILERYALLALRMKQRSIHYSMLLVVKSVGNAAIVLFYALVVAKTYLAVVWGLFGSSVVVIIVAVSMESKLWRTFFKGTVDRSSLSEILRYGLPILPATMIGWVLSSMDKVALRTYTDFAILGEYAVAMKLVSALGVIQTGFTTFWVPFAFETYEKNPNYADVFSRVSRVVAFAMVGAGLIILAAKNLLFLLFSTEYRNASYIASFLLLISICVTISETTVNGINFTKHTHWHSWISAAAALTNLLLIVLLVPRYGAAGAAVSTGAAYVVFLAGRTWISSRLVPISYGVGKLVAALSVYSAVAFEDTFTNLKKYTPLFALAGIVLLSFVYRSEIVSTMRYLRSVIARRRANTNISNPE